MPVPEFSSHSLCEEPPKIHPPPAPTLDTAGALSAEKNDGEFAYPKQMQILLQAGPYSSWIMSSPIGRGAGARPSQLHRQSRCCSSASSAIQGELHPSLAGSGSSEPSKAAAPAAWRGAEPQQGEPTQGPAALRAKMLIGLPGIKDNLFSSVQTHSFMGQLLPFTRNVFGGEE